MFTAGYHYQCYQPTKLRNVIGLNELPKYATEISLINFFDLPLDNLPYTVTHLTTGICKNSINIYIIFCIRGGVQPES